MKLRLSSALLLSLLLLAACNKQDTGKTDKQEVSNSASGIMAKATEEIRTGNMSLGNMSSKSKAKGEITPEGDLLINGKPVTITAEQRQLLIKHRELLVNVAISGVEIGMQGVDLAKKAVGESIKGIFSGESDQVEKKIEAEAKKIEVTADLLCEQLPLLMQSQQQLAESLPEFKPYATMTADDINECHGKVVERK
ncbi:MAG: hypothetical protein ABI644_01590 [Arenimonas sp.]